MEIDLNLFGYILTSLSSTYLIYNTYKLITEPYGEIGKKILITDLNNQKILSQLKHLNFVYIPKVFDNFETSQFQTIAQSVQYEEKGLYLGDFRTTIFGLNNVETNSNLTYNLAYKKPIPSNLLVPYINKLKALVPEQNFNCGWVQKYEHNNSQKYCVNPHKDPANTINTTVIAVFGNFEGAITEVEGCQVKVNTGDVLILRAKLPQLDMPTHSVSTIIVGTRYTLILSEMI